MIYTSYFAKIRQLEKNGIIPISICGKAPEWYKGLQYKKLAPKYGFFMEWKKNHDNDYYIEHFRKEVLNELDAYKVVCELNMLLPNDLKYNMRKTNTNIFEDDTVNIALICYEKPSDFCHRHLVTDWLNEKGFKCEEWKG